MSSVDLPARSRPTNTPRIALTGIGVVTPIGTGVDEFWRNVTDGRSGVGPLSRFDASDFPIKIAAEVQDETLAEFVPQQKARWMERFAQLAYTAALLSLDHAGLEADELDSERAGVVIGTGIGGVDGFERAFRSFMDRGDRGVNPSFIGKAIPNAAAGTIAMELGVTGPNECVTTACASGAHAIARGVSFIRSGAADRVIAGGTEAAITRLALASFHSLRALSTHSADPARASRPFDKDRDGFVIGEGAAVLLLENMDRVRGQKVLAEILGCGASSDAYHLVAPHPEGTGAVSAMTAALSDAGVAPGDVGYVNAHATATPVGDVAEAKALFKVFDGNPPPASSTKSMTGHLIGASGAVEAATTALALAHGLLPPTINYETVDPECDLDVVPNVARKADIDIAISNSFAFGGQNVSLVLGRCP